MPAVESSSGQGEQDADEYSAMGECHPELVSGHFSSAPGKDARGEDALAWITSHNFRKTMATMLDSDEFTAREIADQLGHARPSMTQDVYMGRRVRNPRAVQSIEAALRRAVESQNHG